MAIIRWGGLGGLIFLAGCSHSISGAYVAHGQQFSELLQITQSADGQLLGTLNHTAVKADGSFERFTLNINGTTDGHAITLAGKASEPFAIPINMSGTVDESGISLLQPGGIERFNKGDVNAYQQDVAALGAQAVAIQQRNADLERQQQQAMQARIREDAQKQRIASEDQDVSTLADDLQRYAATIQAHHDLNPLHETHAKILSAARRDLEANGQNALNSCSSEGDAEAAYRDAKVILREELDDIAATLKRDTDTMNGIIKEADSIE
jgi:hypothetical protein